MYRRILLAYDGSVEGRTALRALLARKLTAKVYLLAVIHESPGVRMAEGAHGGAVAEWDQHARKTLAEAVAKLRRAGFSYESKLVVGDPGRQIANYAEEISADLVVLGHRRQSMLERWWSGRSGAYLCDHISSSLLIGRTEISDAEFFAELGAEQERA